MFVLPTVILKFAQLLLITFIGFAVGKWNYLSDATSSLSKGLSKFIVKVTMPCLIFTTVTGYEFTSETLSDGFTIFGFSLAFILLSLAVFTPYIRRFFKNKETADVHRAFAMFTNCAFMGIPVLTAAFGEEGTVYAVFYQLANDILLWTLGIVLISGKKGANLKQNLKNLINPNIISFILAITFALLGLHKTVGQTAVYKFLFSETFETSMGTFKEYGVLGSLGNFTGYLSMFFVGMIMAETVGESRSESGAVSGIPACGGFVLLKQLVYPVLSYFLLYCISVLLGLDPIVRRVVRLQLAMPPASMVTTVAAMYDSGGKNSSAVTLVIGTALAAVTLPIFLLFLNVAP